MSAYCLHAHEYMESVSAFSLLTGTTDTTDPVSFTRNFTGLLWSCMHSAGSPTDLVLD